MSRTQHINVSSTVLWASAFVILALVIIQAGKLPANTAHAEMATKGSAYSLVTAPSGLGSNDDPYELLYVLDNRDQVLLVYQIEDAPSGQIFLRDGGSVVNLQVVLFAAEDTVAEGGEPCTAHAEGLAQVGAAGARDRQCRDRIIDLCRE